MISKLEEIFDQENLFGNKAKNLSILSNKGILIPEGITISFDNHSNYLNSGDFSQQFRKNLFKNLGYIPEPYAVRSSANVEDSSKKSYAGQFTTKLGVSSKKILSAIKEIYTSSNYLNARYYKYKVKMGIIIQKMIESDFSGVLFTYDIINQTSDSVTLELANGRCENIVSGRTNPSLYVINKNSRNIHLFEKGDQNVTLNSRQISKILDNAKRIENIFQKPQDIEFLFYQNKFYCLQSRNITTISK